MTVSEYASGTVIFLSTVIGMRITKLIYICNYSSVGRAIPSMMEKKLRKK